MAFAFDRYVLTVTMSDEGYNSATKAFFLSSATVADSITEAADVLAELVPLTAAKVDHYTLGIHYADGAAAAAVAERHVEDRASIILRLVTDANHKQEFQTIEIPAPAPELFMASTGPGKNIVDVTNADLLAFVALYQAAGPLTIGDGQKVVATDPILSGKRIHRASRKG